MIPDSFPSDSCFKEDEGLLGPLPTHLHTRCFGDSLDTFSLPILKINYGSVSVVGQMQSSLARCTTDAELRGGIKVSQRSITLLSFFITGLAAGRS